MNETLKAFYPSDIQSSYSNPQLALNPPPYKLIWQFIKIFDYGLWS